MKSTDTGGGNVYKCHFGDEPNNECKFFPEKFYGKYCTTVEELEMRGTSMSLYVVAILIVVLFGTVDGDFPKSRPSSNRIETHTNRLLSTS
jgi:hypothetical protein